MPKTDTSTKEPIRIRFKQLKNGNQSIYLDCYVNGARQYKFLNLYLKPGKTRAEAAWNKEQIALANAIKAQYIIDIQNGEYGFKDPNRTRKLNFITYCEDILKGYEEKGQTSCANLLRIAIQKLIEYRGKTISFNQVNKEYLAGFIEFLNNEGNSFNKAKGKEHKPISGVYKEALFARIMVALNKAERDGIIVKNPGKEIDRKDKPHADKKTRCYLTLEEVKKIATASYSLQNDIKPAFLFSCFTGLRHSDLHKLTWNEIKVGADGITRIETSMKKTKEDLYLPLSANALEWLPERGMAKDKDHVFPRLPQQPGNADARLRILAKRAGIDKHITFHVARHTFATLTLTYGADLYTVSKLLGHTNVKTTQIYAKIVDENKTKAVNLIPKI